MYVGGQGYLRFQGGYTYYYSLTDLVTTGTLRLGGRMYQVTGISWLDHQWGDWAWGRNGGWTWMALQLDNGVQLSVFDVHSGAQRMRAASVLLSSGQLLTVGGTTIKSLGAWRSSHTGTVYPSSWTVSIPRLRATLTVLPTVRDQEMRPPGVPGTAYWEGSGRVTGTFQGRGVSGYSYTELMGFARR
jgi:predicted secreted hydrolase